MDMASICHSCDQLPIMVQLVSLDVRDLVAVGCGVLLPASAAKPHSEQQLSSGFLHRHKGSAHADAGGLEGFLLHG